MEFVPGINGSRLDILRQNAATKLSALANSSLALPPGIRQLSSSLGEVFVSSEELARARQIEWSSHLMEEEDIVSQATRIARAPVPVRVRPGILDSHDQAS